MTLYGFASTAIFAFWLIVGFLVLCAICAALLARAKGTSVVVGFVLGLCLGPLGLILVAIQRKPRPVVWGAPPVTRGPWGSRCLAVDPGGMQCGLPSGHDGLHVAGPPSPTRDRMDRA